MMNSNILIYQNQDGNIKIDVRLDEETVWLTQAQMQELFQKSKATISEHIKNVFEEGELNKEVAVREFRTTTFKHASVLMSNKENIKLLCPVLRRGVDNNMKVELIV